jgi:hypothetical protein
MVEEKIIAADEPRDVSACCFGRPVSVSRASQRRCAEPNEQNLRRRGRLPVPKKAPWELLKRRKLLLVQAP